MKTMIYTITTLKTVYGYRNPVHTYELGRRCVGFFYKLKDALMCVGNNDGDIYEEGYYPFCVVEETSEGLYNMGSIREWWFQWIDGRYKMIEKPKSLKNIVNFGIG
jgi:hypothetical protein